MTNPFSVTASFSAAWDSFKELLGYQSIEEENEAFTQTWTNQNALTEAITDTDSWDSETCYSETSESETSESETLGSEILELETSSTETSKVATYDIGLYVLNVIFALIIAGITGFCLYAASYAIGACVLLGAAAGVAYLVVAALCFLVRAAYDFYQIS